MSPTSKACIADTRAIFAPYDVHLRDHATASRRATGSLIVHVQTFSSQRPVCNQQRAVLLFDDAGCEHDSQGNSMLKQPHTKYRAFAPVALADRTWPYAVLSP